MNVHFKRYHKCSVCGKVRRIADSEIEGIAECIAASSARIAIIDCTPDISKCSNPFTACCGQIVVNGEVEEAES